MSNPPETVLSLLREMRDSQIETNDLLRRIVPDDRVFPGGLYDLIRAGLYNQTENEQGTVIFRPISRILDEALTDADNGTTVAQSAFLAQQRLIAVTNALQLLAQDVSDQFQFLANQLSPTFGSISISEWLRVIGENSQELSALQELAVIRQNTQRAASNNERLVTTANGVELFSTVDLLYALGLCQCEGFLESTPPPPPPPPPFDSRPDCLDGSNPEPAEFGGFTPVLLGNATIQEIPYRIFAWAKVGAWPAFLAGQAKAYFGVDGTDGIAFVPGRGEQINWTSFADRFGVSTPSPDGLVRYFGWHSWPWEGATVPVQSIQAWINNWTGGRRVAYAGDDVCAVLGDLIPLNIVDTDDIAQRRCFLWALPSDDNDDGGWTGQSMVVRVLAPPGSD